MTLFSLLDALPRRFRTLTPLIDIVPITLTASGSAAPCMPAYRHLAPAKDQVAFRMT